eukprot:jgi/Mesvir1/24323/Mv11007-RA.1
MEPIEPCAMPNEACQLKGAVASGEGHLGALKTATVGTTLNAEIPALFTAFPPAMEQQYATSQESKQKGAAVNMQPQQPLASRAVFRPVASTASRPAAPGASSYPANLTLPCYMHSQVVFPAAAAMPRLSDGPFHAPTHTATLIKAEAWGQFGTAGVARVAPPPRPRLDPNKANDDEVSDDNGDDNEEDAGDYVANGKRGRYVDEHDEEMETGSDVDMDDADRAGSDSEEGDKNDNAYAPLLPQTYIDTFIPMMLAAAAACRRKRSAWTGVGTTVGPSYPGRSRVATTWSRLELEHLSRIGPSAADCSEGDREEREEDREGDSEEESSEGGFQGAGDQRVVAAGSGGDQGWVDGPERSQVRYAGVEVHPQCAREEPQGLSHASAPPVPVGGAPHPWNVQCSKSDSKGWRCKKLAAPDKKYCPHHLPPTRKQAGKHGKHGRGPSAKARPSGDHAGGGEDGGGNIARRGSSPQLGPAEPHSLEEDAGQGEVAKTGRGRRGPWDAPRRPARASQESEGDGEEPHVVDGGNEDEEDGPGGSDSRERSGHPRKAGQGVDGSGDGKPVGWDDGGGRPSREATPLGLRRAIAPGYHEDDQRRINGHGSTGAKQGVPGQPVKRGMSSGWAPGGGIGVLVGGKGHHAGGLGSSAVAVGGAHTCRRKQARPMRAGEGGHEEGVIMLRRDLTLLHLLLQIGGKGGPYHGNYGSGAGAKAVGSYGQGHARGRDRESGRPVSPPGAAPRSPVAGGGGKARPGSGRLAHPPVDEHEEDEEEEEEEEEDDDVAAEGEGDEESSRCHRTNGKQWRCRHAAMPGKHYCEHHLLARRRSACPTPLPWGQGSGGGEAPVSMYGPSKRAREAMAPSVRHVPARGGVSTSRGGYRGRASGGEWSGGRAGIQEDRRVGNHESEDDAEVGEEEQTEEPGVGYRAAKRGRGRPRGTFGRHGYGGDGRRRGDRDSPVDGSDDEEEEGEEEYEDGDGDRQSSGQQLRVPRGRDGMSSHPGRASTGSHESRQAHPGVTGPSGRPGHEFGMDAAVASGGAAAANHPGGGPARDGGNGGVGRCQRMDGKRWRCSRPTQGDKMYCAHHLMQRFSARPRKRGPGAASGGVASHQAAVSTPAGTPQHSGDAEPVAGRAGASGVEGEASRAATLLDMLAYAVDHDGPGGGGGNRLGHRQGLEPAKGGHVVKRRRMGGPPGPGDDKGGVGGGNGADAPGASAQGALDRDRPRPAPRHGYAMATVPEEEEEFGEGEEDDDDDEEERDSGHVGQEMEDGGEVEDTPSPVQVSSQGHETNVVTGVSAEAHTHWVAHHHHSHCGSGADAGNNSVGFTLYGKGHGAGGGGSAPTPAGSSASDDGSSSSMVMRGGVSHSEASSDRRKGGEAAGERGSPIEGLHSEPALKGVPAADKGMGSDPPKLVARERSPVKSAAVSGDGEVAAPAAATAQVSAAAPDVAVVPSATAAAAQGAEGPGMPKREPLPAPASALPPPPQEVAAGLSAFVQEEQLRAAMLLQAELNHSGGGAALSSGTEGSGDDSAIWRACASGSGSGSLEASSEGSEGSVEEDELARHLRHHHHHHHHSARHAGAGHTPDLVMPRFLRGGIWGTPWGASSHAVRRCCARRSSSRGGGGGGGGRLRSTGMGGRGRCRVSGWKVSGCSG